MQDFLETVRNARTRQDEILEDILKVLQSARKPIEVQQNRGVVELSHTRKDRIEGSGTNDAALFIEISTGAYFFELKAHIVFNSTTIPVFHQVFLDAVELRDLLCRSMVLHSFGLDLWGWVSQDMRLTYRRIEK